MPCSEAAHEPHELVRVEKECRRGFLNPGDLRWLDFFSPSCYIYSLQSHEAIDLLGCSANGVCLGTVILWLVLLSLPECLLESNVRGILHKSRHESMDKLVFKIVGRGGQCTTVSDTER